MAKMFIKSDEAQQELGLDEEGLKQLVREGRLREFRDGATVMYKKEQIDQLVGEGDGGGDQLDLAGESVGDDMGSIGLADSGGASGSIGLADSAADSGIDLGNDDSIGLSDTGSGDDIGISDTGAGIGLSPDDTAADMGLSGSLGGVPSPDADASAGSSGITVLDDTGGADPMAQTAISSGVSDQVNLEPTGSGSGLLDLTRESDDTSLGADVLDDLGPGGTGFGSSAVASPMGSGMGTGFGTGMGTNMGTGIGGTAMGAPAVAATGAGVGTAAGTAYATAAPDAVSSGLGAAALAASLVSLLGILAVSGMAVRTMPDVLGSIVGVAGDLAPFIVVAAIGIVLAVLFFIVGSVIGKR